MPLCYGRKPYQPSPLDFKFSEVADVEKLAATLPNVGQPHGGYGADFPSDQPAPTGWGMGGNGPQDDGSIDANQYPAAAEGAGDCGLASQAHQFMEGAKNSGQPIPRFTCLSNIQAYVAYTEFATPGQAYDAASGANDSGVDLRTLLGWMNKVGMKDADGNVHQKGPYALVDHTNPQEMWVALAINESLEMGINVYDTMMNQFSAGQMPWTIQSGWQLDGGHDFPLFGHPSGVIWTGCTWSRRQTITQNCLLAIADEAWISLDPLMFFSTTGKDAQGYTKADVTEYFALIAQQYPQN
jgi:hypothetical protein